MRRGESTNSMERGNAEGADPSQSAAGGVVVSFGGRVLSAGLRLLSVLILARLLTPRAYGLYGMASVLVLLLQPVCTLGLGAAAVQRKTLADDEANGLFWASLAVGFAATVSAVAAGPLLSQVFSEPKLLPLAAGIAPVFLLISASSVHAAKIARELRFHVLALVDVLSTAIGLLAAICVALGGAQEWALVAMLLVQQLSMCIGHWMTTSWRPTKPAFHTSLVSTVRLGLSYSLAQVATQASRRLDTVLLGYLWGATTLGIYTRAYSLFLAPISNLYQPLSSVAIPSLSRCRDGAEVRKVFSGLLAAFLWTTPPISLFAFLLAEEAVLLALGPGWEEAAGMLRFLSIGGFLLPIVSSVDWVLMAEGRSRVVLVWGVSSSVITAAAIAIGAGFGGRGVAAALSAAAAINTLLGMAVVARSTAVSLRTYGSVILAPFVTLVLGGSVGWIIADLLGPRSAAVRMIGVLGPVGAILATGFALSGALTSVRRLAGGLLASRRASSDDSRNL